MGGFLKSRRDRLNPRGLGLHEGPRRRVPGLRRDEVATLAGASVDYYAQLEQGRGTQPSEQILAALARALHLTFDERNHLYHLAGRALPAVGSANAHVHPGMLDLLDRLTTTPAQIISDLASPSSRTPWPPHYSAGPSTPQDCQPASSTSGSPTPRPETSTTPPNTITSPTFSWLTYAP